MDRSKTRADGDFSKTETQNLMFPTLRQNRAKAWATRPWRATTEVGDYVCCVPSKQNTIRTILREVSAFTDNPKRHRSLMMIAPPGAGKTHLVKQLAKSYDFELLQINITQMLSKRDILDFFDDVATTQQRMKDKKLLVFVDEVNAVLDSEHVYAAFLSLIEEGIYIRNGMNFHIHPCLWLFAGTEDPRKHFAAKGNDFVSRLTLPPLLFEPEPGEESALSNERVYLGVCILRREYPDVRKISKKVLQAFELLRPDVENREIDKFVRSFTNIKNGQVMAENVPLEMFKELTHEHASHPHHHAKWREIEKEPMVEISDQGPEYMKPKSVFGT